MNKLLFLAALMCVGCNGIQHQSVADSVEETMATCEHNTIGVWRGVDICTDYWLRKIAEKNCDKYEDKR